MFFPHKKYAEIFQFNQFNRDNWVAGMARQIPSGSRILDIGAGPCRYRNLFKHCDYKTQDFGELNEQNYGNLDYISDILEIPVKENSFNVILCTEVIEHVPEPIRALQEFSRILQPGGLLLLTAPLGSGIHQSPYHFYGGFTPYWYKHFLDLASFEKIQIEPNGSFFKHYGQESRRFCNFFKKPALLPVWLLLLPWFYFICPFICHFLDRIDKEYHFTIGYHVSAVKREI